MPDNLDFSSYIVLVYVRHVYKLTKGMNAYMYIS